MAQGNDVKLYGALGVLALLGGAYFLQFQSQKEESASHSTAAATTNLPKFGVDESSIEKIDRIVLTKPAEEAKSGAEAKPAREIVLVKKGDKWRLAKPVDYLANQKNVESLLGNLPKLTLEERVASSKESYGTYELGDEDALHVVASAGDKAAADFYVGKSGGRGQAVRLAGTDGVFIMGGLSKYLFDRDTKGWRDLSILEVEPEKVTKVVVENEIGTFTFTKNGTSWKDELKKAKGGTAKVKEFEPSKVDDLVRAFKTVSASGFGDDKTLMDAGLAEPRAVVKLTTESGAEVTLLVGSDGENSSRWAKVPDKDQIFSVSSWVSDWAVADETKFQKSKEPEKDESGPPDGMPHGMPPGMMMGH